MTLVSTAVVVAGIMAVFDILWLGVVAKGFYQSEMGSLLREKAQIVPSVIFYVLYSVVVAVLVVQPSLVQDEWFEAFVKGALLGLAAYGAYNLTNLATLKGFSRRVAVVDLMWGVLVTAAVSTITYLIVRNL